MRRNRVRLDVRLFAVLACVVLLEGCGAEQGNPVLPPARTIADTDARTLLPANRVNPVDVPGPDETTGTEMLLDVDDPLALSNRSGATSPTQLLSRLEAAWEKRNEQQLRPLLAGNYRFAFSSMADPDLVTQYGNTWDTAMELECLNNLRTGFTDAEGMFRAPASTVDLVLHGVTIDVDPAHPDSAAHYKLAIVSLLQGSITLADETRFEILAPHHFYLVRGDAAVLPTGPGNPHLWYIRRWEDRSTPVFFSLPAEASTFGSIKAAYLR